VPCSSLVSQEKDSEALGAAARSSAALPGVRVAGVGDEAQGSGDAPQKATELAVRCCARSSTASAAGEATAMLGSMGRRTPSTDGWVCRCSRIRTPLLSNPLAGRRGFSFRGSGSIYLRAAISFFRRVGLGPEAGSAYWSC